MMNISCKRIGFVLYIFIIATCFIMAAKAPIGSLGIVLNPLKSSKSYGSIDVTVVNDVESGDKIIVTIKDWPEIIGDKIPVVLINADTPMINNKEWADKGKAAKEYLKKMLLNGKDIKLRNIARHYDTFELYAKIIIDNTDVGEELIKKDLARPRHSFVDDACWNNNTSGKK